MEDGLLSLKWNNHKTTFFDILRVLREKANYTDATIAVEGKFYPVHKLVMSTCSEYFSEIFERTPCKSPVVVLKDVRSQDMDALLDYMYLGEVNVNQNDLASLLKTAECLRIKGLAVPDEDPTKSRKNLPDDRRESPPPKRRRHDDSTSSSISAQPPPRPVSPSAPSPSKATAGGQAQAPPVTHSSVPPGPKSQQPDLDSSLDPPPMVKVEMEEAEDQEEVYRRDNSYEGGGTGQEGEVGDYGSEVSKSEHDPESYGGGSYAGPSLQPGGDIPWEEGDSSSFPPEGFSGDLPAGQQPQGGGGWSDGTAPLPVNQARLSGGYPAMTGVPEGGLGAYSVLPAHPQDTTDPATWAKGGLGGEVLVGHEETHVRRVAAHAMGWNKRSVTTAVCSICFKDFMYPSALNLHMRSHTGEKPYTCPHPQCDYRSTKKGNLKRHASTHFYTQ